MISNSALNIIQADASAGTVRPGVYTAPVPQAITGWNQWMMTKAEFFDPFIQKMLMASPRHWYNAIARGAKENFSGLTSETRIFRGGLGHYAGLDFFSEINPVPSSTNNPCVRGAYNTGTISWDKMDWKGYQAYWGSDPICVDQWKYTPQAIEQLAWILQHGAQRGVDIQEVWNRDWLIRTSTVDADGGAGRGYIMSTTYIGNTSPAKFYYDPLVQFGDVAGKVRPSTGITKPFIVFKQGTEVETLNFDVLGALKDELDVSCPDAAIGSDAGTPMFGLPVNKKDFENYIKGSPYEVANWRESRSEKLITGISGVKSHRDWALPWDGNQLRFKIKKVDPNYQSADYAGVAAALEDQAVIIAEYVAPMVAGRIGENGIAIPEYNPEYGTAEFAVAPIQLNKVFTNMFGSNVTSLGSDTYFGPMPGLNGKWGWMNIIDRATNPHGKIGNFEGEFQIFPRPEPRVVFSTSILYRRCVEGIKTRCPVDNASVNPDVTAGTTATVATYVASEGDVAADALMLSVVAANMLQQIACGNEVSVTINNGADDVAIPAIVIKTSTAPTYQLYMTGSGVIDLVAVGDAADTKYCIESGVLKFNAAKTACTVKSISL